MHVCRSRWWRCSSHLPNIAKAAGRPLAEVESEYATIESEATVNELLHRARIDYHAPADAAVSGLADRSVDVVFSNSVLEHVPGPDIAHMMARATEFCVVEDWSCTVPTAATITLISIV